MGRWFLGGIVLLGIVASVLLVLSDSVQVIRVGLVVALWAAVLGGWAVSRYQAKVRELRGAYERELEREINARREYDLGVEARVRAEVGADASEMAALRAELAVLRRHLERLFDGELPPDRPALRAASFRVQELPSAPDRTGFPGTWRLPEDGEGHAVDAWADAAASWSHAADGWADPAIDPSEPTTGGRDRNSVTPVYDSDHPGRPLFADPDDAPITAETAIVRLDEEPDGSEPRSRADESASARGGAADSVESRAAGSEQPQPADSTQAAGSTWADAFTEVHDDIDTSDGAPYGEPPTDSVAGPPRPPEAVHGPPAPSAWVRRGATRVAEAPAAPRKGSRAMAKLSPRSVNSRRRRAQADSGGSRRLSVAEIMANLRREEEQRSS